MSKILPSQVTLTSETQCFQKAAVLGKPGHGNAGEGSVGKGSSQWSGQAHVGVTSLPPSWTTHRAVSLHPHSHKMQSTGEAPLPSCLVPTGIPGVTGGWELPGHLGLSPLMLTQCTEEFTSS